MNIFARFNENPAMTLQDIKETKRYGRTDGQRENSIPPTKFAGGYKYNICEKYNLWPLNIYNGLSQVYCIKP